MHGLSLSVSGGGSHIACSVFCRLPPGKPLCHLSEGRLQITTICEEDRDNMNLSKCSIHHKDYSFIPSAGSPFQAPCMNTEVLQRRNSYALIYRYPRTNKAFCFYPKMHLARQHSLSIGGAFLISQILCKLVVLKLSYKMVRFFSWAAGFATSSPNCNEISWICKVELKTL